MSELTKWLENLKKKNFYPYLRAAWRGLFQYAFYAVCFLNFAMQLEGGIFVHPSTQLLPHLKLWYLALLLLFAYLILYTTHFTFSVFDRVTRNVFMKSVTRDKDAEDVEGVREALVASRSFWVEFLLPIGLCFLFPVWYGYNEVTELIPFAKNIPSVVHRLLITVVFAAVSFVVTVLAHSAAQNQWLEKPRAKLQERGYVSVEEVNRTAYTMPKLIIRLILLYILYSVGAALTVWLLGIGWSVLKSLWVILREGFVIIAILLIVGAVFLRVIWKRLKFYVRLKHLCKQYGFRIVEHRGWLTSLFYAGKSYQLAVEANGKTYYCRMISSFRRKNRMQFFADGSFLRIFSLHIPTPAVAVTSRFAMGAVYVDRSHVDEREFLRIKRKGTYAFDCAENGKKILLINPVPKRVILGTNTLKEADNGDRIGDYAVYTGGAFLRALKNDAFYETR
ncbi:MAG: hypothetical protein E7637_00615 [Ruminococcaceae bacterium]|nr:hypothetical protein [Oscillospiraceae bacterium]